jgi:hypothetical protein
VLTEFQSEPFVVKNADSLNSIQILSSLRNDRMLRFAFGPKLRA